MSPPRRVPGRPPTTRDPARQGPPAGGRDRSVIPQGRQAALRGSVNPRPVVRRGRSASRTSSRGRRCAEERAADKGQRENLRDPLKTEMLRRGQSADPAELHQSVNRVLHPAQSSSGRPRTRARSRTRSVIAFRHPALDRASDAPCTCPLRCERVRFTANVRLWGRLERQRKPVPKKPIVGPLCSPQYCTGSGPVRSITRGYETPASGFLTPRRLVTRKVHWSPKSKR